MRQLLKLVSVTLFLSLFGMADGLFAQDSLRRMYVHLDRTVYAPGEAIWFCAYLRNMDFDSGEPADNGIRANLLDSAGRRVSYSTAMAGDAAANVRMYPGVIFLDDGMEPGRYLFEVCGDKDSGRGDVIFTQEITVAPEGSGIKETDFLTAGSGYGERKPRETSDSLIHITNVSNAAFIKLDRNACTGQGKYSLYLSNDFFKTKIADVQGGMQNDAVLRVARNRLAPGVNAICLENEQSEVVASKEFLVVPSAAETVSCIPAFTAKPSGKRSACRMNIELRDGNGEAVDGKFSISVLDTVAMKSLHRDVLTKKALSSVVKQWRRRRQQGDDRSYLQAMNKKPVDPNISVIDHICNLYSSFYYDNGMMYNKKTGFVNRSGEGYHPVALIVNGVQQYSWVILENRSMENVEIIDMSSSPSALYKDSGGGYVSVTINSIASIKSQFAGLDQFPGRSGPACSFYSPRYDLDRISGKKDMRNTIFWNPLAGTVDGKAEITFCTSDSGAASYYVVINGVTIHGYAFSWQGVLNL